jgi:SAM-dependent methyltransferase
MSSPDPALTTILARVPTGRALDLACGAGRHAIWLAERGWRVTAVDQVAPEIPGVECVRADIERHEYHVQPGEWDLIVCWLYWQPDLLPEITAGVKVGGIAAFAGKLTGRFATSVANYRREFAAWRELAAGEDGHKAWWIGQTQTSAAPKNSSTQSRI